MSIHLNKLVTFKSQILKTLYLIPVLLLGIYSHAQYVPLGQIELITHLDQEISGESAKRNLEFISRQHRMRGSIGYTKAVNFIQTKLEDYSLESIEMIKIPADGKLMYGTQKSRPAWDVEFAELWEMESKNNEWILIDKISDWESIPLVLAQDSHSADVTAELVDIGAGTSDLDYIDKNIKDKLVLTSSQPERVVPLAIEKYGAVGVISYAQNQVTAWWKENENLIRWGHLDTFSQIKTFGFMISLKQARAYQKRLKAGEIIRLKAKVIAGQHPGYYDILTAKIEGRDPILKQEEIAFSCHLDHPRPGANDNASGCMAILEVARTLKKLIIEQKLERPKRTIRFIWSPEIEGTTALLNFREDLANRIKINIHMDMVGGNLNTKALFHVSRSPQSLPNFINDIGEAFGHFVNKSSDDFASGANVEFPIVSKEGGKEALQAVLGEYHMGSDFQVFTEGSFGIPAIYLHDWPDRFIHTNYDTPSNIDPTKLKRSAFIGGASAYFLANFGDEHLSMILDLMKRQVFRRTPKLLEFCDQLTESEALNAKYYFWKYEEEAFNSIGSFQEVPENLKVEYESFIQNLKKTIGVGNPKKIPHAKANMVYSRNMNIKGPLSVFGYDYFFDHYDQNKPVPSIYGYSGMKASGGAYSYETLNMVNGKRTALEIRNTLSAEFGPIPLEIVIEYLDALKSIGVIQ